jgi:large subunit ribosomal protein L10e
VVLGAAFWSKIVHGSNYRQIKSQSYSRKEFAPGAPNTKVARFTTGKHRDDYAYLLRLVSEGRVQVRHNAIEAARVACNKKLVPLGEENYLLKVVTVPHEILKENKMIATAGADRLQEGMRKAFGKPIGLAARVYPGSVIYEVSVKAENLAVAKSGLQAAMSKLPMRTRIEIIPLQKPVVAAQ